jgi:hypothetical protein
MHWFLPALVVAFGNEDEEPSPGIPIPEEPGRAALDDAARPRHRLGPRGRRRPPAVPALAQVSATLTSSSAGGSDPALAQPLTPKHRTRASRSSASMRRKLLKNGGSSQSKNKR